MYIPLHAHSDCSLSDGISKPWQMVKRAVNIGASSIALTDHGSISAALDIVSAAKEACGCCGYPKSSHRASGECLIAGVTCEGFKKATVKSLLGVEAYLAARSPLEKTAENRSEEGLPFRKAPAVHPDSQKQPQLRRGQRLWRGCHH